ncbi:helix-turn-helix transcriptional regulator [Cohnella rhizosphaerae]|uniref:AraC family transcriptional regulator n=1 Tax=Cohnella rhizosphaerae TaxID=1457232 RepID=A0A9X4KT33_9BACL|nr:AraC family transcriptional regulator [Cohnella rhizosphaerae]MDG0810392.1 AraC family transcriptional regulator [Cohnella rhizosphaerae]
MAGIGLLLLLGCACWIVLISRRHYKPLQYLIGRITPYSDNDSLPSNERERYDEFRLIETAMDQLITRSGSLEKKTKELALFRKSQLFLELLEPPGRPFSKLVEDLRLIGTEHVSEASSAAVMVMEMDRYAEFVRSHTHRDQHQFKQVLHRVVFELCERDGLAAWSEWMDDSRIAVVLFKKRDGEYDVVSALRGLAESAADWIRDNLPMTVTISIGPESPLQRLSESCEEAKRMLSFKCSFGDDRLLLPDDVPAAIGEPAYPLQHVMPFVRDYRNGSGRWSERFRDIGGALGRIVITKDQLDSFAGYLVFQLNNEMKELPKEFDRVWNEHAMSALRVAMDQSDTTAQLLLKFEATLADTFERLAELRLNKNIDKFVTDLKHHVHRHFSDPDFSLSALSEQFNLSHSHLSRVFKETVGVNFIDYITDLRIREARKLLESTDLLIQDVAIQVGYNQVITFIKVFKKQTGVTPGAYRKTLVKNANRAKSDCHNDIQGEG